MSEREPFSDPPTSVEAQAASWLARRDRGLTPAEQDAHLQWLREDPRHGATVARLEKSWLALDAVSGCRPEVASAPDPDLLARPAEVVRRTRVFRLPLVSATLAAAAAIAGFFLLRTEAPGPIEAPLSGPAPLTTAVRVIPGPERRALADGSTVELNDGGRIETLFTPTERRIRLLGGEAHFTVAKNAARPFIVETAGAVAVRAVGTQFDVRHAGEAVEVLVTEGLVRIERTPAEAFTPEPTPLGAGERATVASSGSVLPRVTAATPAEIERLLAWRSVHLEFPELPLADVVAEFNRWNHQQLRIEGAAAAQVRVAGRFRADKVDAFVRLLEASFGVTAERADDGAIVLRRSR